MSFPIRYGRPKTATINIMKGFLDGFGATGEPSGRRPVNAAKLAGVNSLDDAGGARPVNLAIAVRIHRINVKIPRTDPSVCRKFPNCSATDTIAKRDHYQNSILKSRISELTEK